MSQIGIIRNSKAAENWSLWPLKEPVGLVRVASWKHSMFRFDKRNVFRYKGSLVLRPIGPQENSQNSQCERLFVRVVGSLLPDYPESCNHIECWRPLLPAGKKKKEDKIEKVRDETFTELTWQETDPRGQKRHFCCSKRGRPRLPSAGAWTSAAWRRLQPWQEGTDSSRKTMFSLS